MRRQESRQVPRPILIRELARRLAVPFAVHAAADAGAVLERV